MVVRFKKLFSNAVTPSYAREGDAGLDLTCISRTYDEYGNMCYGTGIAVEIPFGYVGLLFPRSSVSKKQQILANSVGVIDSGYRGEIMLKFKPSVTGHSKVESLFPDQFELGEKIGQLIIIPYPQVILTESDTLSETVRGEGGFGHTGN